MSFIFILHVCICEIPLLIYDVIYDITTIPVGIRAVIGISFNERRNVLEITISLISSLIL